jgi:hypothetical protein
MEVSQTVCKTVSHCLESGNVNTLSTSYSDKNVQLKKVLLLLLIIIIISSSSSSSNN